MHPVFRRVLPVCSLLLAAAGAAPAVAGAASGLEAYDVPANQRTLSELRKQGFDTTEGISRGRAEVVATRDQVAALRKAGLKPTIKRDAQGNTAGRSARRGIRPDGSYDVYRPYFDDTYVGEDSAGKPRQTIYEEMLALADANPGFIEAVEFGRSRNDKPLLALRMTKDAKDVRRGERPAVMYQAAQHAREWITPEMIRRFAQQTASDFKGGDARVRRLLSTRELWFAPVLNPDGYDFTFTPGNRLWRKNLRELNGIPGTQAGDGVDLNRNFPTNWGRDDEGSSPDTADETYRGDGPASEPETKAINRLYEDIGFVSVINWHSAAELLLYPFGYQVQTPSVDDAVYRALSGTDADPAIKGSPGDEAPDPYDPDVSAELYTTNGDTIDHAVNAYGTFTWTPEMDESDEDRGGGASVFEFQDSEADVQAAFAKNVPFALDVADSADDMSEPESHLGNTVPDFQPQRFPVSYGDPQPVAATVKRKLGPVTVRYRINGGPPQSAPTSEVASGERSGGVVMHDVRGTVTGTKPGDRVQVVFEAGGKHSGAFSYDVAADTGAPVLLLQAENYTGASAFPAIPDPGGPSFGDKYAEALTAAGVTFDTYDVDARGAAPDLLGVLSHYKAVVWYTGNDLLPRAPGQGPGTGVSKVSNDTMIAVRSFMHEGGKLLLSGQHAAYSSINPGYAFNPQGEPPYCDSEDPVTEYSGTFNRCVLVSDDFFQYDLGAYIQQPAAGGLGAEEAEAKADVGAADLKLADEFGGGSFQLNGGTSADNQVALSTSVTTSSILRGDQFARFASKPFSTFDGPNAFAPATGSGYAVAQDDAQGWRRLQRTVDLTGKAAGTLEFKLSHDTEPDYDYVFVEAHTVGADDWTTLPDANGHTSTDTGSSCSEVNWNADSPFVNHYQTRISATECEGTGTTGEWNAATGSSGGYQDWSIDLSAYAGKQVEVSITYLQDPASSGLGVFVDDARVTADGTEVAATGFETDLGGFQAGPAPEGSVEDTQVQWRQSADLGLAVAPGVATANSVYLAYGLEGVREAGQRNATMTAALTHLGVLSAPTPAPTPTPTPRPRIPGRRRAAAPRRARRRSRPRRRARARRRSSSSWAGSGRRARARPGCGSAARRARRSCAAAGR